jgi:aromatic-L-amino-acid decarboxylase
MAARPPAAAAPEVPPSIAVPPEPAEIGRVAASLARLGPALDGYTAGHADAPFPPFVAPEGSPLTGPLPEEGLGAEAAIDGLAGVVANGSRMSAPGFVGFITTGASTVPAVAGAAVAVAGGQRYTIHAFNVLERTGLAWLADLCGLPAGVAGVFSSGGSTANLVALGAARQAAFERLGVDAAQDGTPAGTRGRIYASTLAHRTVHRSAAVLGLGRGSVAAIPVDADGRIRLDELEAAMAEDAHAGVVPIAVVAIAGTTDTGSVDAIGDVTAIARRHGAWVHVDGAYGLVANASPALAPLFAGVEAADSWIVDPHKWLATGVGIGATYVRDEGVLTRAFAEGDAAYLEGSLHEDIAAAGSQFDAMAGPWADQGVELSAPPRGVVVWALLREIGRAGVIARVERHVGFAAEVAARARAHPRLELLMEPQLSIACFRYLPAGAGRGAATTDRTGGTDRASGADDPDIDAVNRRILDRLRRETRVVPTSTVVRGRFAIRPCFINPRTTEREVAELVDAVVRFGDEITGA